MKHIQIQKKNLIQVFISRQSLIFSSCLLIGALNVAFAGKWVPLANQPTFLNPPSLCALYKNANCAPPGQFSQGGVINVTLLTDGRVLMETAAVNDQGDVTFPMYTLSPDNKGNYVNGSFKRVANLPDGYAPFALASALLPDGRVIYEGGEYNGPNLDFVLTGMGAIYDPVVDQWTAISPPPFFQNLYPANPPMLPGFDDVYTYPRYEGFTSTFVNPIGDSASVVLPDGTFMLADKLSRQQALLNINTLTWTLTGAGKNTVNSEEGWTLLPNGKVLVVDLYLDYWFGLIPTYPTNSENTELYDPATGKWSSAGQTPNALTFFPDGEIGAAILMPDGKVFATGSTGNTAIYDSYKNTWSAGPKFPIIDGIQARAEDAGGALLPNGNVLQSTCAYGQSAPNHVFEFDGKKLIQQPDHPDRSGGGFSMLILPNGQILAVTNNTDLELYNQTQAVSIKPYSPVILSAPLTLSPGKTYTLTGILLNGVSQGAMFGNEAQSASNYPLVRITNLKTGHVFYNRTHDFSSMAVASIKPATTKFDVPATQETGPSKLEVVANGVPSIPWIVFVK